jgi:hypothetical protein
MSTVPAAPPVGGISLERELKYVLPAGRARLARSLVSALCRPDPNYPAAIVTTIYYDTPSLELLSEKINSDYLKTKLRLRWYSPARGATTAFLEVKSRVGGLRHKVRVATSLGAEMVEGLSLDHPTLEQVLELARPLGIPLPARLMPALVLRYERSRFIDPVSASRISVDLDIEALRGHPRLVGGASGQPLAQAVVEIKGPGNDMPRALQPLINLGARRAAFSKYGAAGVVMLRYSH